MTKLHPPNPEPRTPHPTPRIPNPEPRTPNPKPQTPNPKPRTPNPEPQTKARADEPELPYTAKCHPMLTGPYTSSIPHSGLQREFLTTWEWTIHMSYGRQYRRSIAGSFWNTPKSKQGPIRYALVNRKEHQLLLYRMMPRKANPTQNPISICKDLVIPKL